MSAESRILLTRILALLAVVTISVYIYSIRERAAEFEQFGYAGIFIICFMAYATVFLPAPGIAVVAAMGGVFNPLWVAVVAGVGAACGELVGYLAGYSGRGLAEKTGLYQRMVDWTRRYGMWAVFGLSAIPNPVFDIAGAAAGTLKMPIPKFFVACLAGELIKMAIFSYGGSAILEWIG